MITFPFWCPACKQQANAKADPVGLLFGGTPDLVLTCENCDVSHKAVVEIGALGNSIRLTDPDGSEKETDASE